MIYPLFTIIYQRLFANINAVARKVGIVASKLNHCNELLQKGVDLFPSKTLTNFSKRKRLFFNSNRRCYNVYNLALLECTGLCLDSTCQQ